MSGLSMRMIHACRGILLANAPKNKGLRPKLLVLVDRFLEPLAGSEGRDGLRVDLDLLAVHRAAARARLAGTRKEGAEADHGDALALRHVGDDRFEHRVDRFACRNL